METEGWSGHFWLAGRPSVVRSGALRAEVGKHPELWLDEELTTLRKVIAEKIENGVHSTTSVPAEIGPGFESHTIQGVVDQGDSTEVPITLFAAYTFSGHLGTQRLRGTYVLIGAHHTVDDAVFTRLRVQLQHLDRWAWGTTPEQSVPVFDQGSLQLERPSHPGTDATMWLRLDGLSHIAYRDMDRQILMPLASLSTLAVGAACPVVALQVSTEAGTDWLSLHGIGISARDSGSMLNVVLPLRAMGLEHVADWLGQVDRLGPLPAAIADAYERAGTTLDAELILLTTTAESLHSQLYPDECRMSEDYAARIRQAAVEAAGDVADDGDRKRIEDTVRGLLDHLAELAYNKRLRKLAEVAAEAIPDATGEINKWASLVSSVRNDYAHSHGARWLDEPTIDKYLTVDRSLRWVLAVVLLREAAGVPADVIAEHLKYHQPYAFFLQYVRQWSPDIYPQPQ